jgi:hypothetical protein
MKLTEISPSFREALAVHSMMLMFGIDVENIFVARATHQGCLLLQVVAREGGKEFSIVVAELEEMDESVFRKAWTESVRAYNAASHDERAKFIDGTKIRDHAAEMCLGLVAKGFVPREVEPCPDCDEKS